MTLIPIRRFPLRAFGLLLALGLAACSSNDDPPLAPDEDGDPVDGPPVNALSVVGVPRVAVVFDAGMTERLSGGPLTGNVRAILSDSIGRRVFLPDVRMQDSAMVEERDMFDNPNQYTLQIDPALPELRMSDTLRFEVRDGGEVATPFTIRIIPSQLALLPDSAVFTGREDLTIPWSGQVERVILSLIDSQGFRIRTVFQLEHYSGLRRVTIPARDLALLRPGVILVSTNVLDTEVRLNPGEPRLTVSHQTNQNRAWILQP